MRHVRFLGSSFALFLLVAVAAITPASATVGTCDTAGPIEIEATAGTTGPTPYATLTLAVAAINAGTHQGAINIEVCGNSTEAAAVVLNGSGAGAASYTSILLQPNVDAVSITGPTVTGRGLIELNGADNVTIDGDNPNSAGTNRDLTLTNTAANTVTFTSVIRLAVATTVTTSANGNTVRNCVINGSATGRNVSTASATTGSEFTTFGIFVGGGASTVAQTTAPAAVTSTTTTVGTGATATSFTVTNNQINAAARGVQVNGGATTVANNLSITNNVIGAAAPGTTTIYSRGITVQGFDNTTISGNLIQNMSGFVNSTAANSSGIGLGSDVTAIGTNAIVERNVIAGVNQASPGTYGSYGINANAGNNVTIRNNFVYGVTGDMTGGVAFSTTFGLYGIRVASGTGHRVYHNSVSMTGLRAGTATTALLSAALGVVTTTSTGMDIRNNLLSNTQSGGTTSIAYVSAYLPSGATSTMNLTWNNNGYYTGTTATSQGLAQVGTTAGTGFYLAGNFNPGATSPATNFRAYTNPLSVAATNDNGSFATTSAAPFTSATDLHIPAATATQLESGGSAVPVPTDIDGEARSATTPDIGADEFTGIAVDLTGPAVTYTTLANTLSTANRPLAISVTDLSGVPTAGAGLPVLYYRKGNAGAYAGNACSFNSGSTYDCLFDYTLVSGGSVTAGDLIQYYVAAQDNAGNVTVNPSTGAGGLTPNPPAAGTPPTAPNSYSIAIVYSGSYNVGTGQQFTSLTNAGGAFAAINAGALGGNVTINVTSNLTGETGANALNQWIEDGVGSYTLTIKPSGGAFAISGPSTALGMIILNGADRVTLDGSQSGGSDQSLTLTNTNTGGTVIWIRSASASDGATGNTVKNCILVGSGAFGTISGVLAGGQTLGNPADAPNHNNAILNNTVSKVQNAAFLFGNATTLDQNWNVSGNTFGSSVVADKLAFRGMLLGNAQNFTITGNTIRGINSSTGTTSTMSGIQLAGVVNTGTISKNRIFDIRQNNTAGWGSNGIFLAQSATAAGVTVANNFIWDIASQGFNGADFVDNGYGIVVATGGGYNIWSNSINMNTNQVSATGITAAINVLDDIVTAGSIDIRNNIFSNSQTIGVRYAIYSGAAATVFSNINYNDYFAQNVGFLTSARANLANWQTATSQDANSKAVNPDFVSATDLHLSTASIGKPMENAGVSLPGVTTDFDGDARGPAPEIGADEVLACAGVVCTNPACGTASCDTAGLSGNCSILTPGSAGLECRASAGNCDVAESCDGLSPFCPGDVVVSAGNECRASAGDCDVAESCNGTSGVCPADGFVAGGNECRASLGACDLAETCSGSSAACPADALVGAGVECRGTAGVCDLAESCDGASVACPADLKSTASCRSSAGDCDVAESCDGAGNDCPADGFEPSTTECRASTATCDPAETCTGLGADCPADVVGSSGTIGNTVALAHNKLTSTTTVSWTEVDPGPFNVYRGGKFVHNAFAYNHACFAEGVISPSATDTLAPVNGQLLYYLVSRESGSCDESGLGSGTAGPRPNATACPDPGADTDADGWIDALDNCPTVYNPAQTDVDGDSVGDACDNCPVDFNPDQADGDSDTIGDACE